MIKELVVAEKEFKEYITGKRFIAIFAILLIICVCGMISGLGNYNTQLNYYKDEVKQHAEDPGYLQMIEQEQQSLASMESSGAARDQIDNMQATLDSMMNPYMPSMATIFYSIMSPFYMIGMALAVAVGFDLISKEKEDGSLKSLLSHPIFRDSVINGKAIAAVALIAVSLAATFLVVIAIMLLYGVVPAGDDLARVLAFFGVTLLYCIVFLAISIMVSTLVKNSTMSILCILGIFLVAYSLPSISSDIASFISGPSPVQPLSPGYISVPPNSTVTIDGHTYTADEAERINQENQNQSQILQQQYNNESRDYWNEESQISSVINVVSPLSDYEDVTGSILNNEKPYDAYTTTIYRQTTIPLMQSLSYKWGSLVALFVMSFAAFGVSYVAFMRTDIR